MNVFRTERDSIGEVEVPEEALFGAGTQRAVENFSISDLRLPGSFISALALIKAACARGKGELKLLESDLAGASRSLDAAGNTIDELNQLQQRFPFSQRIQIEGLYLGQNLRDRVAAGGV